MADDHAAVRGSSLSRKLRASRTLLPQLQVLHDRLLDRSSLYNSWHLQPYALPLHGALLVGLVAFGVAVVFQSVAVVRAANACESVATGNWTNPATWTSCGGTVPGAADTVTIQSGHTVTVDDDAAASSVVITANNTAGGNGITIAAGKTLAVTGAVTITAPTMNTTNGTLAVGSGSLMAGSIAIGGATTNRIGQLTLSTGTVTTTGSVTFTGTAASARFISTGASTANISGDFGSGGTVTTSGTGTIRFTGNAAQSIGAYTTYNNLEVASTGGSVSFLGTATIGGTLTVSSGTLDIAGVTTVVTGATLIQGTLQVSNTAGNKTFGDITVANGGTVSFTAAEAIAMNGNLAVNGAGAITGTTGLWTFQRAGGGTISGSATAVTLTSATFTTDYAVSIPFSVPTITVTGVTLTNNSTVTAATALSGTGSFIQGTNATLNLGGTSAITALTATASPNTVQYVSTTGAQTLKGIAYHHLVVAKSAQIGTLGGAVTVNGNLAVSSGSLNDGGFQITGNATGTLTVASGATLRLGTTAASTAFPTGFVGANISLPAGSTVVYNSNPAQTIAVPVAYANLSLVATAASTKTLAGPLTVNGTLNVGSNNTLADAGNLVTAKENIVMTGAYTGTNKVLLTGSASGHTLTGTGSYAAIELDDSNGASHATALTVTGPLTLTAGTWTASNTLSVGGATTINGTLAIASTTGTKTFAAVTVASGGTLRFTAAEALDGSGTLTVASGGTVDFVAAGIINLAADFAINGTGALTGTSGTWTFSKPGGTGTIGGSVSSLTFPGNVSFTTSYTVAYPLTVNGMAVGASAAISNPSTMTVNGTLSGTGTFIQGIGTVLNVRSVSITNLGASATGNIVRYIDGGGTVKGTTYNDLEIAETPGATASAQGTLVVLGNLVATSGILNPAGSTFTVMGSTDIYEAIRDVSGGGSGGNNTFEGPVTVHPGADWIGIPGEVVDYHFKNGLTMNGNSFVAGSGTYFFEGNDQTLAGSLTADFRIMQVDGITLAASTGFDISNTLTLASGARIVPDPAAAINGSTQQGTLTGNGSVDVTRTAATADFASQYNFSVNVLTGVEVRYVGTAAQVLSSAPYVDVTIDNPSGVTLPADVTVGGTLALTHGLVATGASRLIMGSSGSVARTDGYVVGRFQKAVPTGAPALTFEIGDATQYAPLDIAFTGVTSSGDLLASVTSADHPDIANSGLAYNKSVNRYWTMEQIGLVFGSYDATFHFVSSDLDPGTDMASLAVAKKDASWTLPAPGIRTATSTQATGMTDFSDYVLGKAGSDQAPVASAVTVSGSTALGSTLLGGYTYTDAEGDLEGTSTFRWLRNGTPIPGATAATYVITADDLGATLTFEVTPVAQSGTTPGLPAVSAGFSVPVPSDGSSEDGDTGNDTGGTVEDNAGTDDNDSSTHSASTSNRPQSGTSLVQPGSLLLPLLPPVNFMADTAKSLAGQPFILLLLLSLCCLVLYRWPWILAWLHDDLYVGRLDRSLEVEDVKTLFDAAGTVDSVRVHDRPTHRNLRYAFVRMRTDAQARKAMKTLHGKDVRGHALTVRRVRDLWRPHDDANR